MLSDSWSPPVHGWKFKSPQAFISSISVAPSLLLAHSTRGFFTLFVDISPHPRVTGSTSMCKIHGWGLSTSCVQQMSNCRWAICQSKVRKNVRTRMFDDYRWSNVLSPLLLVYLRFYDDTPGLRPFDSAPGLLPEVLRRYRAEAFR